MHDDNGNAATLTPARRRARAYATMAARWEARGAHRLAARCQEQAEGWERVALREEQGLRPVLEAIAGGALLLVGAWITWAGVAFFAVEGA